MVKMYLGWLYKFVSVMRQNEIILNSNLQFVLDQMCENLFADVSFVAQSFSLSPNNSLANGSVFEMTQLGFVSPKLAKSFCL